jgi:hypothetical protein
LHAQLLLPLRSLEGRLLQSIRHATHVRLRHVSHVACVNGLFILGEVREFPGTHPLVLTLNRKYATRVPHQRHRDALNRPKPPLP